MCSFSFLIFILPVLLLHRKFNKYNGVLVLETWILTAVILLTSGDIRDAGALSGHQGAGAAELIRMIPEKLLDTVNTLIRYSYSRIEYLLIFACLAFIMGFCSRQIRISGKTLWGTAAGLILTAIGTLMINTMIEYRPARVISIPLIWTGMAVMLIMFFLGGKIRQNHFSDCETGGISVLVTLILLTVAGAFFLNNFERVRDIRTAWIERDRILSGMNGSDTPVKTCAIPVMGSSQADPCEDPLRDFNIVTAYYYGFPSITADHLCPPFDDQ